jgi:hypothetical protein
MRVAVLPTGRLEWSGLPEALSRLFPGHSFTALPSQAEVDADPSCFPMPGFTGSTLTVAHELSPPPVGMGLEKASCS